jgi:hypothetical protein
MSPVQFPLPEPGLTDSTQQAGPVLDLARKVQLNFEQIARQLGSSGTSPWVAMALISGYANLGAGYTIAQYRKTGDGQVHLRGLVTAGPAGSPCFNLPAGFRPAYEHGFNCPNTGGGSNDVRVRVNGDVTPLTSGTAFLDVISFFTD